MIPALLTDDGIERTVARIYRKKGIQVAVAPRQTPPSPVPTTTPENQSMTGDQNPSESIETSSGDAEVKNEIVKQMTQGKDPVKIPTQSEPSGGVPDSTEKTKSMGAQRGLFLLIGVLILGVIYFLFRKEAQ